MARLAKGMLVGLLVGILVPGPALAGGGCHNPTIRDAVGTKVEMKNACFTPSVLRTQPGETVTWTNQDNGVHVVIGVGWGARGELGAGNQEFMEGDSASRRFDEPGIYAYSCYLHPGMNGAVIVGDGRGQGDASAVQAPSKVGEPTNLVASTQKTNEDLGSMTLVAAAVAMALSGSVGYTLGRRLARY